MDNITNLDQFLDEEINYLHERISTADVTYSQIKDLISTLQLVKSTVELSREYYNRDNSSHAYKLLLNSMTALMAVNQTLITYFTILNRNHES